MTQITEYTHLNKEIVLLLMWVENPKINKIALCCGFKGQKKLFKGFKSFKGFLDLQEKNIFKMIDSYFNKRIENENEYYFFKGTMLIIEPFIFESVKMFKKKILEREIKKYESK